MALSTKSYEFRKTRKEDADTLYKYMEEKKPELIQQVRERVLAKNSSQW